MKPGPSNAITDLAGLKVGSAHDAAARTGVTVILGDEPLRAAVDIRGGGPGSRETEALSLETLVDRVDAIVLSGGSVYGLAAADSVCRLLGAQSRGFSLVEKEGVPRTPIVPAAVLYDLANGGAKDWGAEPPYLRLGEEALRSASASDVRPGKAGAGYGARAGAYEGGLGTASAILSSGYAVGAVAAVNAFGSPYVPGTASFWAAPFEIGDEFGGRGMPQSTAGALPADTKLLTAERQNTTIAVVATDADLTAAELKRVAIMAQDGLARAIRPAHGPTDGDIVFAVSTARRSVGNRLVTVAELGTVAGDTLARAIARGVYEAEEPKD